MVDIKNTELTISLGPNLAHAIKAYAAKEGTTPEDFIVSALRELKKQRALQELKQIQDYGRLQAEALGIYSEDDLFRYLES